MKLVFLLTENKKYYSLKVYTYRISASNTATALHHKGNDLTYRGDQ